MKLGIDASNIRRGGGVTHLVELLRAAEPAGQGFDEVVVWAGGPTLAAIEDRPWLRKVRDPALDGGLAARSWWQRTRLSALARREGCDLLFVPGGSYAGDFRPMATLSQNLLPFELVELKRFGWSKMGLKLRLLRLVQSRTFRNADGLVFLTKYARDAVLRSIGRAKGDSAIIPHGIEQRFSCPPRPQRGIEEYGADRPFRLLYVSILDVYKHQDQVAKAVAALRGRGLPVAIDFVGPSYAPAEARLLPLFAQLDPRGEFLRWTGPVPYAELHARYAAADLCVFASSCENLPIILLEGMAAGLPIACSSRGPMPEVLGDAGLYFNPEDPADIGRCLEALLRDAPLRASLAARSWELSRGYSWRRCAADTFGFFARVARAAAEKAV